MRKRNIKTKLLLWLRHRGMLCKKPVEVKRRIKISHTVYPEGNISPIEAERAVWVENKKAGIKGCMFDVDKKSCTCGVKSIDDFARGNCKKKKK
jgi:hypothetical protein